MPIPKFKDFMLPFLQHLSDNKEHTMREVEDALAARFKISESELAQTTPSGRMTIFNNRVGWSKTYLKKAGLIDAPKKALFKITPQGQQVLEEKPDVINPKFLERFPSFLDFKYGNEKVAVEEKNEASEVTPEETMEEGYQSIVKELQGELLTSLKTQSPNFFERVVVDLLLKMGYGGFREDAGQAVGRSGDEGIDGIINEDKLGLDIIYIQAKRWADSVGRPEIMRFVGALGGKHAKKGVFITTSRFTPDALSYVKSLDVKVVLIDGDQLAKLMIDHNVGVQIIASYEIKRIDSDYFIDE
jgi:restriction system protein